MQQNQMVSLATCAAAPRAILPHHVPQAVNESRRIGPVSRTAQLSLAIGLPLRNQEALGSFLEQSSNPAAQVDLSKAFNGTGITSDGKAFSADWMAWATPTPARCCRAPTFNNTLFRLGAADKADVVSATTSAITLPAGQYSTVAVLATGVNGAQLSQSFKVTYTDGTSSTFTQSLSDWYKPASYPGEVTVSSMPYRNTSSGVKDNRPFELYEYTFSLTNSKTVSSISLPGNNNVKVFAVTLKP